MRRWSVPPEPKYTTYQKNGTGRDNYIAHDNGGLLRDQTFVTGGFERGLMPRKRHYVNAAIPTKGKMKHYNVDGSGRDVYVGLDNGGFSILDERYTANGRGGFVASLRHYARSNSRPQTAFTKDPIRSRRVSREQKSSVERLSVPKRNDDPYQELRTLTQSFYR